MRLLRVTAGFAVLILLAALAPTAGAQESSGSPAPSGFATPTCPNPEGGDCLGALTAGTYTAHNFVAPITYTVPDGWANMEDQPGNFLLLAPGETLDGVDAGTSNYIAIYWDAMPQKQDCSETPDQDVPRSAEAIAQWLSKLSGVNASKPQPITVGGIDGYGLDVSVDPTSTATCPDAPTPFVATLMGDLTVSHFAHALAPGLVYRYLLLDGTRPIAVEIGYTPRTQTFSDYVKQVQPIVDSLRFASRARGVDATLPPDGTFHADIPASSFEAAGFGPDDAAGLAGTYGLTLSSDQLGLHFPGQDVAQDCAGTETLDRDLVLVRWTANCAGDFGYQWNPETNGITIATPDYPGLVSAIMANAWVEEAAVSPSESAAASASASSSFLVVGLGDSLPGGMGCYAPCRDYVTQVGEAASAALGRSVLVNDLATNDGLGSGALLQRVQTDNHHRAVIAAADIITLQIGRNDWFDGCYAPNLDPCLTAGQDKVEANLDAILSDIEALRAGRPTAIRVLDYYNAEAGDPALPSEWNFPNTPEATQAFRAAYDPLLKSLDSMICRVAAAHGAVCVDILQSFNGPDGSADAAPYLQPDHTHPNADGAQLIASLVAASGFAPLDSSGPSSTSAP